MEDNQKKRIAGYRSRAAGQQFERMLNASCRYYENKGIAVIEKTPEPMRPIRPYGDRRRGQYIAVYEKKAQPDYKGILCDGSTVLFEAKHTDGDRINQSVISSRQEELLNKYKMLGARCFVMVSMHFEQFYRIPWETFRIMKVLFEHKYMNERELAPYRLPVKNGTILILEGVELYDRQEE